MTFWTGSWRILVSILPLHQNCMALGNLPPSLSEHQFPHLWRGWNNPVHTVLLWWVGERLSTPNSVPILVTIYKTCLLPQSFLCSRHVVTFHLIWVKGKISTMACDALFNFCLTSFTFQPYLLQLCHGWLHSGYTKVPGVLRPWTFPSQVLCMCSPLTQECSICESLWLVLLLQWRLLWPYIQNCMVSPNTAYLSSMLYFYPYHCYLLTCHILYFTYLYYYFCLYSHSHIST